MRKRRSISMSACVIEAGRAAGAAGGRRVRHLGPGAAFLPRAAPADATAMPWLGTLATCAVALLHVYLVAMTVRSIAATRPEVSPPRLITVGLVSAAPTVAEPRRPVEPFSVPIVSQQAPPPLAMTPAPTRRDPPRKQAKAKPRPKREVVLASPKIPAREPAPPTSPPMPPPANAAPPRAAVNGPPATPVMPPSFSAAYLDNPRPAYPALSRRNRESGVVRLRVQVNAEGRAQEVRIESSSGHQRLDEAALRAVRKWKFVPARRGKESVAAWVIVPIAFRLQS